MRDDLLDAQAAVDWAVSQIPLVQNSLIEWQRGDPYLISRERDPNGLGDVVVAIQKSPLPLTFNAWFGSIFNSLRSALDLLATSLATRNGEKTNRHRHFPIFDSCYDMIDPVYGIDSKERKKWLSQSERSAIKMLRPYKGGDAALWTLHEIDIVRKHERLISTVPRVLGYMTMGSAKFTVGGTKALGYLDDKTILYRLARQEPFSTTKGNTLIALEITFEESALGLHGQHAITAGFRRSCLRNHQTVRCYLKNRS